MTVTIQINGEKEPIEAGQSLKDVVEAHGPDEIDHLAVAVNGEVVPRGEWQSTTIQSGDELDLVQPIQGGAQSRSNGEGDSDPFVIAGDTLSSRLLVGTGGYNNFEKMRKAIVESETDLVTVGLRRVNVEAETGSGMMEILRGLDVQILPNTAGCYTADDAVTTAKLGREALDTNWVKLEVIGDEETLYPDVEELLDAARQLVEDGFVVLPYTSDDPITAKKLASIGCEAVMPLASPIGSGRGIANPDNLIIIREELDLPMIIDAGIGCASDAAMAMELGADAILSSSAIARAEQPHRMARALRDAVRAGRESYLAGRIPKKLYAKASTPREGRIKR